MQQKKLFLIIFIFCILYNLQGFSKTVSQKLYINRGILNTVKNFAKLPFLAFNSTTTFTATNAHISMVLGDSLVLNIINTDSASHSFTIQNTAVQNFNISAKGNIVVKLKMNDWGTFIFYDPSDYPTNRYMGLAGMIAVEKTSKPYKSYFWNIKEHSVAFNTQLSNRMAVNWETYNPDYFTFNSLSYPDTDKDTTASIRANVGDTLHIFMANTGQADHAIHFHGYHCKILQTSKYKNYINFSKDSFPLESMQTMVLELIIDKSGLYPVHDHNLLAMTGNKIHPYGMMLIIDAK